MEKHKLIIQIGGLLLGAILFASCNGYEKEKSNENIMEPKEHQHGKHSHGEHGFTNKKSVEEMAKKFESGERDFMQKPQQVLEYIGDVKGKTVMDIGAGTGYFSVRFADKGANVIAADVSEEFQNYLKERVEKNMTKNIELRKVLYDNPLLKDGEVDIVFIANAYHHIESRIDYFTKVKKGLKANGELVVLDYFNGEIPKEITAPPIEIRVSVDQVVFELKNAGFTSFEVELNLLQYQYIIKAK